MAATASPYAPMLPPRAPSGVWPGSQAYPHPGNSHAFHHSVAGSSESLGLQQAGGAAHPMRELLGMTSQRQPHDVSRSKALHRSLTPPSRLHHQEARQATRDDDSVTGPSLATASSCLENAEELRTLREARLSSQVQAHMCHAGHAAVETGRRPPALTSRWWEQDPNGASPVTMRTMHAVVRALRQSPNTELPAAFVGRVLADAEAALQSSKSAPVQHLRLQDPVSLVVVGDTHGQLEDVLWIFQKHGLPSRSVMYLFNGDIADRGQHAIEIYTLVLGFLAAAPAIMHINRGHHEDEIMNHARVGGFYDECLSKYGRDLGGKLFQQMCRVYALLPIATVISKAVFVVHGGLSRCDHFLSLLESLHDRSSRVPVEVHDAHDQALVDALWSDPVDRPGFSPSSRGGNIMCFGPDVTQNFLRENGYTLVVRSHQVPENNDGFFSHHGNRLLTVFSASNYCGSTGNQGAVLIFREKMGHLSYDVSRHFAPEFSSGAFQIPMDPTPEYEKILNREEVSAVQRAMQRDPTNQRLHTDVLGQVARLVVEHKAALWAFFFRHDSQKSGFVGVNIWLQGCRATIGDLPWPMLQKLLAVEEQGTSAQVDYFAFLERFRVRLSGDEVTDQWTDKLLARIYQRLLQYDISLREILAGFDHDGTGVVTISELREAFAELDVGITTRQATSLMRTISSHASSNSPSGHVGGGIDVNSFLSRFEMVFRPCAGQRDIPPWITTLLKQLGRLIYGGIPGEEMPENRHPPEDRARQIFEAADRDGDGTLTYDEFATALSNLLRHAGKVMQVPNLSEVELLEAARWIDTNRGGSINYLEFLSGFTPNDVIAGNAFHVDLLEHICTIVWSHKPALLFACLRLDPQHTGEISRERLVQALRGLNFSLHSPLTDEQILMLVDHTRFDAKTGHVRYQRFLDSFQVFDTQSPARS